MRLLIGAGTPKEGLPVPSPGCFSPAPSRPPSSLSSPRPAMDLPFWDGDRSFNQTGHFSDGLSRETGSDRGVGRSELVWHSLHHSRRPLSCQESDFDSRLSTGLRLHNNKGNFATDCATIS